jgi:type IV pilus assembly protein PilE
MRRQVDRGAGVLTASLNRAGNRRTARTGGFSLVELMIAVTIAGILASIAYPSYTAHLVRGNRSAAQSLMLEIAARQERFLLDRRGYTDAIGAGGLSMNVPQEVANHYNIILAVDNNATPPIYAIVATPLGGSRQLGDGALTLTSQGTRLPAAKWQ